MNSRDSTGVQEDDFTMAEIETNQDKLAMMTLEAQLVVEEDTERVAGGATGARTNRGGDSSKFPSRIGTSDASRGSGE
jgi:hypothetical protein